MTYVWRVWCEWDIGQEYHLFASEEAARKYVEDCWDDYFDEETLMQDAEDDGYLGFEQVKVPS